VVDVGGVGSVGVDGCDGSEDVFGPIVGRLDHNKFDAVDDGTDELPTARTVPQDLTGVVEPGLKTLDAWLVF
jgi:hypothetical protein